MKKILILFLLFFLNCNFSIAEENNQIIKLNSLFSKLSKNEDIQYGDLLEKEIWAIWNKHPDNVKLTDKLELGTKLMYQGRYDYALKVFTNVINSDAGWAEAWNKRATLLFFMKDYQKSLKDIDKVLKLEPRHFGALSGRAQIYIELELYQEALSDLKKAKKIHPMIRGNKLIEKIENIVNGQTV